MTGCAGTSHLKALSAESLIFQKFQEYIVLYKHRFSCTLSYPEDYGRLNSKIQSFSFSENFFDNKFSTRKRVSEMTKKVFKKVNEDLSNIIPYNSYMNI